MPRPRPSLWIPVACAALSCTQADEVVDAKLNVVLIVVDTLRRDHLGCYGYEHDVSPNIDGLAATGVRYENAWSQAPWTTPSIGALLTSRYPSALGIESEQSTLKDEHLLLSEALQQAGYRTAAVISHSFCSSRWNFDQGFDVFDESNVQGHAATTSPSVSDRAIEVLDELGEDPFFLWLHYFDPHFAYVEQADHARSRKEGYKGRVEPGMRFKKLLRERSRLKPADLGELKRLYDSEVSLTDHSVGRVLDALRARGLDERTLVILTADHGEEFMDHSNLGHAKSLHSELIHVPLIVRWPNQPPDVVDTPVALIDVFPTVLSSLDLPLPDGVAGVALLDRPATDRVIFSETARTSRLRAAIDSNRKVIRDYRSKEFVYYDLLDDPRELEDLALSAEAGRFDELLSELDAWAERMEALEVEEQAIELSAEELGHLESLGYSGD